MISTKTIKFIILSILGTCIFSTNIWAQTPPDISENNWQETLNYVWILTAAGLVFLMQAGFMCLEAGVAAAKHSINVAIKNMADFIIAVIGFWTLGFGLMFGTSEDGWIGTSEFLISVENPWTAVFFIFQSVFVGTAATIDSGAIAGRTKFGSYLILSALISVVVYPIFGHWAWGSLLHNDQQGWLEALGFVDFAGSTVVHSVGGWVGLAGIIIIGPRMGKFDADGNPQRFHPHNMTLAYLGTFILFFGWFGFNGGSTLEAGPGLAPIILNTILAGCFGGISASALSWFTSPLKRPEGEMIMNGVLGGLVAITAGCNVVETPGAAIIGFIGGMVVFGAVHLVERILKLDDVVGAIAVHGFGGAWGTIATGIFMTSESLGETSRWTQVGIQTLGVVVCFFWSFGIAYCLLRLINSITPLRVPPEDERLGLNISEHGATSSILEIAQAMHQATTSGNFSETLKVEVEHGTESGDLAQGFNRMIDAIHSTRKKYLHSIETNVGGLIAQSENISLDLQNTYDHTQKVVDVVQETMEKAHGISDSFTEIRYRVEQSSAMNQNLLKEIENTHSVMNALEQSASEITKVVTLIDKIAFKTQLLALNASVEAAKAGRAGKGFSVVAEEIKNLSNQVASATQTIDTQVEVIRDDATNAVNATNHILHFLNKMNTINTNITHTVKGETENILQIRERIDVASDNCNEMLGNIQHTVQNVNLITQQVKDTYNTMRQFM